MPIIAGVVAACIAAILVVISVLVYLHVTNRKKREQEKRDQMKQEHISPDPEKLKQFHSLDKGMTSAGFSASSSPYPQGYGNVLASGSMHGPLQKPQHGI